MNGPDMVEEGEKQNENAIESSKITKGSLTSIKAEFKQCKKPTLQILDT